MNYNIISTDDHMQEPRDLWTRRLSKEKWGNRIPEVRRLPDGRDCWHIWDKPFYKYGRPMIGAVNSRCTCGRPSRAPMRTTSRPSRNSGGGVMPMGISTRSNMRSSTASDVNWRRPTRIWLMGSARIIPRWNSS